MDVPAGQWDELSTSAEYGDGGQDVAEHIIYNRSAQAVTCNCIWVAWVDVVCRTECRRATPSRKLGS